MVNLMETVAAKLPKSLLVAVDRIVAGGRFANRSEVLRAALREFVASRRTSAPARPPPARGRMLRSLANDARYRNRFVALHADRVIDADDDLSTLVRRILARPEHPVYIERVTEGGRPTVARIPGVRVRA